MAWWNWLVSPGRQAGRYYGERAIDRHRDFFSKEHGIPPVGDPVHDRLEKEKVRKISRLEKNLQRFDQLYKLNAIQEFLNGEQPGKIGAKGGLVGQTQAAAINAFQGTRFEVDPKFLSVMEEYRREMDMAFAEVLLKRVSNVMSIASRSLPRNGKYRQLIMGNAHKRVAMYESRAYVNPEQRFRLGAFLLQQATDKPSKIGKKGQYLKGGRGKAGGKNKRWAKMKLPKPTPKWVIGFGKAASGKRGMGAWHESLREYTSRFIKMQLNHTKRFNAANRWYRAGMAWAMNGVLRSSRHGRLGVKVDTSSRGYKDAEKTWRPAITRATKIKGRGVPMGKGTMLGTRDKPFIMLRFSGTLAPKVFPELLKQGFKKDTEDLEKFLQRRSMRRIR